jgi:hypothetical protein
MMFMVAVMRSVFLGLIFMVVTSFGGCGALLAVRSAVHDGDGCGDAFGLLGLDLHGGHLPWWLRAAAHPRYRPKDGPTDCWTSTIDRRKTD